MKKKCLRNNYRKIRDEIPESTRKEKSRAIFSRLKSLDEYKKARRFFIFVSVGSEVETIRWLDDLLKEKEVLIPATKKGDPEMKMARLLSKDELVENYWGILELPEELAREREETTCDLIITPGLAFDHSGYRMGYGGGFYDRFFSSHAGFRLGVGFHEQLVENVPRDEYDLPVHAFLSEEDYLVF
ncbi:5-formyltetrahydrofolate cyclo-ligase [Peptoniphilus sp. EMRHCC_23]|uniref:5-formyltetrahydrofolate cyclo-ligase n=1 Tax=Peptoniphilus rachelemmaiella TaxID=2811779 RepID=UPI001C00684E|nr:5-formyltetrahydrofolate cyclo-ligase [Peptoniphilus rachelemmaiella]